MCQFVRLVKGTKYIQEVQEMTRRTNTAENCITPAMNIDEAMLTPPVRLALEMGVDGGVIRNETLRQLNHTGRPYDTVEDLLKAVFDGRENNEEPSISNVETSCTSVCRGMTNSNSESIAPNNTEEEERIVVPTSGDNIGIDKTSIEPKSISNLNTSSTSKGDDMPIPELLSLEEENRKLKDARLCKICLDEEVAVVYLPCGHLGEYNSICRGFTIKLVLFSVSCVQCAPGVEQCPLCRTAIKGFVRTYLS